MKQNKEEKDLSYIQEKNQNPGVDQPRVVEPKRDQEVDDQKTFTSTPNDDQLENNLSQ